MSPHRENVIHVLQLFASKSEQFELYWDRNESVFVPDVLKARWEESYWPDSDMFRRAFADEELRRLQSFHNFLADRGALLPKRDFRRLMQDIYWDGICRLAADVLDALAENASE